MPYITKANRMKLAGLDSPDCAGELNFMFTAILNVYLEKKGESYQTYNDIIGALEGCKIELYRRKVAAYEDTKIKENGDVYRRSGNV